MEILKSASKIVFILVAVISSMAFLLGKLSQEQWMILAGLAFGFYFSNKGDPNSNLPYLGK